MYVHVRMYFLKNLNESNKFGKKRMKQQIWGTHHHSTRCEYDMSIVIFLEECYVHVKKHTYIYHFAFLLYLTYFYYPFFICFLKSFKIILFSLLFLFL